MAREWCFLAEALGRQEPCIYNCDQFCMRRRRHRKGGLSFVPSDLPGLVAWYRRGLGMSVSAWTDQIIPTTQDFVQATSTNQPSVTSAGSLLFDGSDNYMAATFTLDQPFTIYGLVNPVTWTAGDRILGEAAGSTGIIQITGSPQVTFNLGSALSTISPPLNALSVIAAVGNGASSVLQLNLGPTVTGDAGAGAMTNPLLAARAGPLSFANTDNYEWIFYNTAHDAETRKQVVRYLAYVGYIQVE